MFYLLSTSTLAFAAKIESIEVKNNKRISKETIATYGKIKINKDYNQNQLNQILKNLYDTNFFEDVSLSVSGNTLIIDVKENKLLLCKDIKKHSGFWLVWILSQNSFLNSLSAFEIA